jgi:hypothetical protein
VIGDRGPRSPAQVLAPTAVWQVQLVLYRHQITVRPTIRQLTFNLGRDLGLQQRCSGLDTLGQRCRFVDEVRT